MRWRLFLPFDDWYVCRILWPADPFYRDIRRRLMGSSDEKNTISSSLRFGRSKEESEIQNDKSQLFLSFPFHMNYPPTLCRVAFFLSSTFSSTVFRSQSSTAIMLPSSLRWKPIGCCEVDALCSHLSTIAVVSVLISVHPLAKHSTNEPTTHVSHFLFLCSHWVVSGSWAELFGFLPTMKNFSLAGVSSASVDKSMQPIDSDGIVMLSPLNRFYHLGRVCTVIHQQISRTYW